MKLLIGFAAIVCLSAASAMAGDGRLTNQSLAKIGLVGMQGMSDVQGLEIRGLGISEGNSGYGNHKDHHKSCEGNKCQAKGHCGECGHQHQSGCQESGCHTNCQIGSLCHVQNCGRTR